MTAAPACSPTLDRSAARHPIPRSRRIPTCRSPPSTLPFALATLSSPPGDIPEQVSSLLLREGQPHHGELRTTAR